LLCIFLETFSDRSCLLLLLLLLLSRRAKKLTFDLWSSIIYYYIILTLRLRLLHLKIFFDLLDTFGHIVVTPVTPLTISRPAPLYIMFLLVIIHTTMGDVCLVLVFATNIIICESWLYFIFRMYNK